MSKKAIEVIKIHLDKIAKKDESFNQAYSNKEKSMDKCFAYIVSEARKRGNAVCMKDEEVFGLAVHYYVEGDIKDVKMPDDFDSVTMSESKQKRKESRNLKRQYHGSKNQESVRKY